MGCDLLKFHYLCGSNDNNQSHFFFSVSVVICSNFITFVVATTTFYSARAVDR